MATHTRAALGQRSLGTPTAGAARARFTGSRRTGAALAALGAPVAALGLLLIAALTGADGCLARLGDAGRGSSGVAGLAILIGVLASLGAIFWAVATLARPVARAGAADRR